MHRPAAPDWKDGCGGVAGAERSIRLVDERVVDVVTGKHAGLIGELMVEAHETAVLANRLLPWKLIWSDVGIDVRLPAG